MAILFSGAPLEHFLFIIQVHVASRQGNCQEQAGNQAPAPTLEAKFNTNRRATLQLVNN